MNEKHMNYFWDANTYDSISNVQENWARTLISKRNWNRNEKVLDAGCGTGRVTRILLEYLPNGMIYGIDNDPNMIKKAKDNLVNYSNIVVMQSNLTSINSDTFPIKFDVIFSNAVLHWILNHFKVFNNFYDILNDNGSLLIQCGGFGNLQKTIDVFDSVKNLSEFTQYFSRWKISWNFAKPEDTKNILKRIGYKNIKVYLTDTPVSFKSRSDYSIYLKTVVLGPYLKYLPNEQLKEKFIDKILSNIENKFPNLKWKLEYVRLNIFAKV